MSSTAQHHAARRAREDERGTAIILGLFFAFVAAGIVVTGTMIQQSNRQKTRTSFQLNSQALQFARAGMTEAVNWFRRQNNQPVVEFAPRLDPGADPAVLDTDDEDVGLVREFAIRGKTWGRYEVWKEWDNDPDSERLAWRQQMQCSDVGLQRSTGMEGAAWRILSIGYVYEREDGNVPFNETPNKVIATRMLEAEIMRRRLAPPGQSALTVGDGNSAHINTYGRIEGGSNGSGIFYPAGSGTPTTGPKRQKRVTGTPALATSAEIDMSVEGVFGVSFAELRATSDSYITDARDFPAEVPNMGTVVAELNSITFNNGNPLVGTGIVFIRGNVSIIAGSMSNFRGLLYIDGNLSMRAPALIEGAVVCTGNMTLQGSGDYATIRFDDGILNALRQESGQYRFVGAYHQLHADH